MVERSRRKALALGIAALACIFAYAALRPEGSSDADAWLAAEAAEKAEKAGEHSGVTAYDLVIDYPMIDLATLGQIATVPDAGERRILLEQAKERIEAARAAAVDAAVPPVPPNGVPPGGESYGAYGDPGAGIETFADPGAGVPGLPGGAEDGLAGEPMPFDWGDRQEGAGKTDCGASGEDC